MSDVDAVVIGAGAVGLACARALALTGRVVVVLEPAAWPGAGISSRNSEVIHSGLYYPTGSLKHRMCVEGRRMLYAYLESRGVPHRKCGKLVVATDVDEQLKIEGLFALGQANGVEGLSLVSQAQVAAREPEVNATAALFAAETGVFDTHQYLLALIADIEGAGGHIAYRTPLRGAKYNGSGFRVHVGGGDSWTFSTPILVNSAGLAAPDVARLVDGVVDTVIPTYRFARGVYFRHAGSGPFSHLIYPAPVDGGLGVHATLDMEGNLRFGPDVEWLPEGTTAATLDYTVSVDRAEQFVAAIRRYWPGLAAERLQPDFAGIRPKLSGPGEPAADFRIDRPAPGLVHLYGIESPGLTSSLAIARHVVEGLDGSAS